MRARPAGDASARAASAGFAGSIDSAPAACLAARALSPDTAPAPAPGGGTRGRAAAMRCSRPASFAELAGGRYCRATPLRARSARRTRRRIFAANTSPDIRGEWWRPPRAAPSAALRAPPRLRGSALPPRTPRRRGFAPAAGGRILAPRSTGRRDPRARSEAAAQVAAERVRAEAGGAPYPARVWTRRQRTCDGVVPTPSCAPADGEAAGFAARSRQPRWLPAAGAERRELTQLLATLHLRDDGRRPSRSSRSSPRPCGS